MLAPSSGAVAENKGVKSKKSALKNPLRTDEASNQSLLQVATAPMVTSNPDMKTEEQSFSLLSPDVQQSDSLNASFSTAVTASEPINREKAIRIRAAGESNESKRSKPSKGKSTKKGAKEEESSDDFRTVGEKSAKWKDGREEPIGETSTTIRPALALPPPSSALPSPVLNSPKHHSLSASNKSQKRSSKEVGTLHGPSTAKGSEASSEKDILPEGTETKRKRKSSAESGTKAKRTKSLQQ